MFPVDLYVKVRRAVMVENKSERAVARYFGLHRNTVKNMYQFAVPPGYRRVPAPVSPTLAPFVAIIDAILEAGFPTLNRLNGSIQLHRAHRSRAAPVHHGRVRRLPRVRQLGARVLEAALLLRVLPLPRCSKPGRPAFSIPWVEVLMPERPAFPVPIRSMSSMTREVLS